MNREKLQNTLDGGIFMSSMMGITDGAWVAERAEGMCMVQIGAYIADIESRDHPENSLLPESEGAMEAAFAAEIDTIRARWGDLPICLNAAPGDLESAVMMARSFAEAGGDIFELNCHGTYATLLDRGLLQAMMYPERWDEMKRWLEALCATTIPVVAKFNGTVADVDFRDLLKYTADIENLFGIHLNIRSNTRKAPNIDLVKTARPLVSGILFCSGYLTSRGRVIDVLEAGADCVGISEGLRQDPHVIQNSGLAG